MLFNDFYQKSYKKRGEIKKAADALKQEESTAISNGKIYSNGTNGHANGHTNGYTNGHANGHANGHTNGHINGYTNGNGFITNGLKDSKSEKITHELNGNIMEASNQNIIDNCELRSRKL